jgi:hypothetical protein
LRGYRRPPGRESYAYVTNGCGMVGRDQPTAHVLAQVRRRPDSVAASRRSLRGGVQPQGRLSVGGRGDGVGGHRVGRTKTYLSRSQRWHLRGWPTSPKNTVPADKNGPHPSPPEYRTVQQIDTVLSDKNCRAVRQIRPSSWGQPTLFETIVDESPAKAEIIGSVGTRKKIAYSPTSITVLPNKE